MTAWLWWRKRTATLPRQVCDTVVALSVCSPGARLAQVAADDRAMHSSRFCRVGRQVRLTL
jgi:hypothetical protein